MLLFTNYAKKRLEAFQAMVCTRKMRLTSIFLVMLNFCLCNFKILRLPCGKFDASFTSMFRSKRLLDKNASFSLTVGNLEDCIQACLRVSLCKSINLNKKVETCELLFSTSEDYSTTFQANKDWLHVETQKNPTNLGPVCVKKEPCKNKAQCVDTCDQPGYVCACPQALQRFRKSDCAKDIAFEKTANQSSLGREERYASNAVDGDFGTACVTKRGANQWWRVDFGKVFRFDEIVFILGKLEVTRESFEESKVMLSNSSDFDMEKLCHQSMKNLPRESYRFRCLTSPAIARYLRVVTTKDDGQIVLFDVCVYGWEF